MGEHQRTITVYLGLLAATLLALGFGTQYVRALLSAQGAALAVASVAFVKLRFIATEFMELRGSKMQRPFDIWLIVAALLTASLLLR